MRNEAKLKPNSYGSIDQKWNNKQREKFIKDGHEDGNNEYANKNKLFFRTITTAITKSLSKRSIIPFSFRNNFKYTHTKTKNSLETYKYE